MAEPTQAKVKVTGLHQVGIVVRDLESSIRHYESLLGIGPWRVPSISPSAVGDMSYHGRPAQHSFRIALTTVGSMELELIQPVEGDSSYSDFLREHGEGIHHLGHVRVDNLDEAVQALEREGFPCVQGGHFPGGGYAYMDMVTTLGYIVELLQRSE